MTSRRGARFTRGLLLAAFSVLVAALSHSFAGGVTPGWLSVVLALAFASMFSVVLAKPHSAQPMWRTVLAVGGSQLIFHGLFSVLGATPALNSATSAGAGASSPHAGHLLSAPEIASQLASAPVVSSGSSLATAFVPAGAHHDAWMLFAHALAGLITIAAVLRGEQSLTGLARTAGLALRGLLVRPIVTVVIPDAGAPRPALSTVWVPRPLDVVHAALRHRGPPVVFA